MTAVATRRLHARRSPSAGAVALVALALTGCGSGGGGGGGSGGGGGGGGPGAAIYNGSFEILGANPDGKQPDGWAREGVNTHTQSGFGVARKTGSGFMPSDGQFFVEFPSSNLGSFNGFAPGYYPTLVMYQDDVDLSAATSLIFDYETADIAIGTDAGSTGYDGSARVRIYFQPNSGGGGTVDLWVSSYGPGAVPEQIHDQIVPLPALPVPGRLAIEVTTTESRNSATNPATVSPTRLTFRLDYLAAQ